jgi:hypothetical protein
LLQHAWLVIKSGVPIWSKTIGRASIDEAMAGAIIGALSMFSTTELGQPIKSVEMAGVMLHIRPFINGMLNLVVIGDREVFNNQELLEIIEEIDGSMNVVSEVNYGFDMSDTETMKSYLADQIDKLNKWFQAQKAKSSLSQDMRDKQLVGLSSKIALIESRIKQEEVSIVVLNSFMQELYDHLPKAINPNDIKSIISHLRGWISVSSSVGRLIPELIFLDNYCIAIKPLKFYYVVIILKWNGVQGDPKVVSKARSWLSQISRRIV